MMMSEDESCGPSNEESRSTSSVTLDLTLGIYGEATNTNHPLPSRVFPSQALGGHQNPHKQERTLARRAMRMDMFSASLGVEAHASTHQRMNQEMRGGGTTFVDQAGLSVLMDYHEPQPSWPGSFRLMDSGDPPPRTDDSSLPDLNLKL